MPGAPQLVADMWAEAGQDVLRHGAGPRPMFFPSKFKVCLVRNHPSGRRYGPGRHMHALFNDLSSSACKPETCQCSYNRSVIRDLQQGAIR